LTNRSGQGPQRPRPALARPRYPDLPVTQHREVILDAIRENQVVVVAGETGSGKSTQLPKLCLELGLGVDGLIGHTQPRRLAARAVSERIAEELGVEIGAAVGYSVRFNDRVGPGTYIKVMTDGILLAEVQRDPMLRAYDVIILDEAHERSLNIDFLLGYIRQLLPRRPDLKLIVTSATIDTARFADHFGGAPVVEVSGRSYPVEVRYRPPDEEEEGDLIQGIAAAVQELIRDTRGDILVFLSGEREIRDAADALRRLDLRDIEMLPLYARLSAAEQHRVFSAHSGRRVVLATNVAETSLTVPGITAVVDPGTARISRYNRRTKVQRLPIEPISQASADQRAGRCGRVAPGTCVRLYAEEDYASRPRFTDPEILRTNLASVILQMAALGLGDIEGFPFVEAPDARSIKDGLVLLEELGALRPSADGHVRLTKMGQRLARLPVDPRLARMIVEAGEHGCVAEVLVIVSVLSIQDPRERPSDQQQKAAELHGRFADGESDFMAMLNLWRYVRDQQQALGSGALRRLLRSEMLHHLRIREWQDLHSQLRQVARGIGLEVRPLADEPDRDGIHRALLAGLLSHVGMWDEERREYRGARESRFVLAGGSGLGKRRPKWVVAAELVETDRLRARTVAQVSPDRIEQAAGHLVTRSYSEAWWDRVRAAAVAHERVSLYGLPLVSQRPVQVERIDPPLARRMFIQSALVEGDWDARHAFLELNRQRVVEVLALEHRVRRDLLVSDEEIERFYDQRIPAEITTGKRFDRWWKLEQRSRPDLLDMGVEDLVVGSVDLGSVDRDFPEWCTLRGTPLPLTYVADSSAELDGVTVDCPLLLLDHLEELRLDWQVPGHRLDLVAAVVRSLPKEVRRRLGPAQQAAADLLRTTGPEDGPLLEALPEAVSRAAGAPVRIDPADIRLLPPHLRVTYRAVDDRGRPLAWSRDLAALRRKMRSRVREALAERSPVPEQEGLRAWPAGELPQRVEVVHAGSAVTGYPALVDEVDSVAVRVLPTAGEQRREMWDGTRRLLLLQLGSPLRTIDRSLGAKAKAAVSGSRRSPSTEVYRDCASAAVDHLLVQAGGPVWDAAAFDALLARVRADFAEVAGRAARSVAEILAVEQRVEARLSTMVAEALDETVLDVQAHLDRLLHRGWITAAGTDRLADVGRFMSAIEHRVDKAVGAPERDRVRMRVLRPLEQDYATLSHRDLDGSLRWMLEELRAKVFAEHLSGGVRVSEKSVRHALARL